MAEDEKTRHCFVDAHHRNASVSLLEDISFEHVHTAMLSDDGGAKMAMDISPSRHSGMEVLCHLPAKQTPKPG